MYSRRSSPGCVSRLLAGLVILAVTIIAFSLYQNWRGEQSPLSTIISTKAPSPTVMPVAAQPSATPGKVLATAVPAPVLKVLSDKAGLVAEITELYLAPTHGWGLNRLH